MATKKEATEELFGVLAEALEDARYAYDVRRPQSAKGAMDVAEKTMEAIRLLNGDDDWQCREPHCTRKHNDRGTHKIQI